MRGIIACVGFKQVFVPYNRDARFAGKSKFFVLGRKVISNFLNAAIVNFSSVPLQIASYCGLCAILGTSFLLFTLFMRNFPAIFAGMDGIDGGDPFYRRSAVILPGDDRFIS